jgi:uncharacterized protein (TIGR02271 family)
MEHTLVALFENEAQAKNALNELAAAGFAHDETYINASQQSPNASSASTRDTTEDDQSFGAKVRSFFSDMFGSDVDESQSDTYAEAVRRGNAVLTIRANSDEQVERASEILNRHHPIDVDDQVSRWKNDGWSPRQSAGSQSVSRDISQGQDQTIPVIQEELKVGKRQVQRGGVRVYQRVQEQPVNESVQLREEQVHVERRPVNEEATQADLAALKEGTIELRETSEEAVVNKSARVVEEVVIDKQVSERTETIHDTVRGTEVEVEQLGAQKNAGRSGTTSDDADFRNHWQTAYSGTDGQYEDYADAYRYGSTLATEEKYRGYRWDEAEPRVRQDWETTHAGTPWDKAKNAVRYGWERK